MLGWNTNINQGKGKIWEKWKLLENQNIATFCQHVARNCKSIHKHELKHIGSFLDVKNKNYSSWN